MSALVYFFLKSILPKYYAKANAASLPEGSIRPYRSYSTVKMSPVSRFAHVPLMSDATSLTLTYAVFGLIPYSLLSYITTQAVIILVNDAISRL